MRVESCPSLRRGRLTLIVLAAACVAVWSIAFPPARAEAGSLVIPAWSFARGNVRIYASPDQYADAGPLVGNDPQHSGEGVVEYDIDFPATGQYTLTVSYPCMFQATWDRGFFREIHPFSEKLFLASHSPAPRGTGYGIYVLDGWGNRAELYSDPEISCFRPEPPLSFGSHLSKLVDRIRSAPCKGKLTDEEFIKIVTWIDANVPYLGRYGGQGGSQN